MTIVNYLPGVHFVSIWSSGKEDEQNPIIKIKNNQTTKLNISFVLTGMNKLKTPGSQDPLPFYLYLFLIYNKSGKDFEILSSAQIYCKKEILELENVKFSTTVDLTPSNQFTNINFINNYLSIEIVYSDREAEDGSDLNFLLNNTTNKLFRAKINIALEDNSVKGDSNE